MKILVLGSSGQLGKCLFDSFSGSFHNVCYTNRLEIDISNFDDTRSKIVALQPDIIINATAFTDVEGAEDKFSEAFIVNHLAVDNLGQISHDIGCWLIHFSTDYVFDGLAIRAYCESDPPNPCGVYGASKLKGEISISHVNCKHVIIRTSWLFSEYGSNFLKTMLRIGRVNDQVRVVYDQLGAPTYARDLADAVRDIVASIFYQRAVSGVFHFSGSSYCSWFDFAKQIFKDADEVGFQMSAELIAVKSEDYPSRIIRPTNSRLDTEKIYRTYNISPSNWKGGIKRAINYIVNHYPNPQ